MMGSKFYYSSLDFSFLKKILKENGLKIVKSKKHLKEKYTGLRDLLMIVKKID